MLQQQVMIEKVRVLCERDDNLVSALMYGWFTLGEGDEFSDIEFHLFFRDEEVGEVDEEAWVSRVAPAGLYYVNEFGNGTAVFENLVRGEFHFEAVSNVGLVENWEMVRFPSLESAVLVDKDGELSRRMGRIVGPPRTRIRRRGPCSCATAWSTGRLWAQTSSIGANSPAPRRC